MTQPKPKLDEGLDRLAPRVAAKHMRTAMAVMIRNVAGHNWGWFSREDQRMHVQTVEDDARSGPNYAKVWLENRGVRTFEHAVPGKLGGPDWKRLEAKVRADRAVLESRWITFMIKNRWISSALEGSVVTVAAYPGTHDSFVRRIDLRDIFPGAYPRWEEHAPVVDFDDEHGMLRIGTEKNADHREHLDMGAFLFTG